MVLTSLPVAPANGLTVKSDQRIPTCLQVGVTMCRFVCDCTCQSPAIHVQVSPRHGIGRYGGTDLEASAFRAVGGGGWKVGQWGPGARRRRSAGVPPRGGPQGGTPPPKARALGDGYPPGYPHTQKGGGGWTSPADGGVARGHRSPDRAGRGPIVPDAMKCLGPLWCDARGLEGKGKVRGLLTSQKGGKPRK